MDWQDPPRPKNVVTIGESLAQLSIGELEERVAAHLAEVERIRTELSAKRTLAAAAASIFKD